MKLDIPFYQNDGDGNQCLQVAMKTVLNHFLQKDVSLSELDRLTGRKEGYWTWTSQIVPVLHDLGLDIRYYSSEPLAPYLEGAPFIRSHFGADAKTILDHTDLPVLMASLRRMLDTDLFENRVLSFPELEAHLQKGHVPLVMIDHNKIAGKKGPYQGHFVALTGFDEAHFYYHESGPQNPEPHKRVPKSLFDAARSTNGTDHDVVIVYGAR